ncbi:hypothetical protein [Chlorobaculum parvum]|uniref:hypothetical protein n=1 Tax=Chlorobaculum parvum TaxID=274539 RepID=UPI001E45C398|nr:hypothetical protein [Chlorobaculum parvum]
MDMVIASVNPIDKNALIPGIVRDVAEEVCANAMIHHCRAVFCRPDTMNPDFDKWHSGKRLQGLKSSNYVQI